VPDRPAGRDGDTPAVVTDDPGRASRRPPDELVAALEALPGRPTGSWRGRLRLRAAGRLAHTATDQLARRERTKAAVLRLGGELRRIHLACGRRLVDRGVLDTVEDVDLLTVGELRRAVRSGDAPAPEALARRRRWGQRHADDGPLPVRFRGRPVPVGPAVPVGDRLEGWAASSGRFTGTAVLVRRPEDPFPRDGVLVAEATDPSWSPLFVRAGAIVLERGGPLSHAAILARELGVPAVLNVTGATALAGRRMTVDGDRGIVLLVDDPPAEPDGPVSGVAG
jgi:pyruvate,water dikinase